MKILHITLGLGNGGAEGALFRLVKFDSENEHVVISIMGDGIYGSQLRELGVTVHSLNIERGKFKFSVILDLFNLVKITSPDVVQTWLYHADLLGGIISRIAGVKCVVWGIRHSNLDRKLNSRKIILLAKISGLLSSWLPRKIISCSKKAVSVHAEFGYDSSIMEVIPNGYDLSNLIYSIDGRSINRTEWGVLNDEFIFGMVGRWDPLKDHDNLLAALSELLKQNVNNFKCVLVGPGIDSNNCDLVRLIESYHLADYVILAGQKNNINLVMSAFDVLVLPSSGEAFPNVVAEAMACKTPCVVTDVGDAALIVDSYGWVVPPQDSVALAIQMQKVMIESRFQEHWRNVKDGCRQRIENNFDINLMVAKFSKVWNEVHGNELH